MSILDFILFGLSIIVFAAGAVFMIHQVFCGLDKTALNDKYVWGMNIQGFYFLSAAGTGILAVTAVAALYFGPDMNQEGIRIPAAIAFGCLISSQILMAADLGRPFRAWRIVTGKNFLSPLTLDFLVLLLLSVASFVMMFGIFTGIKAIFTIWCWGTLAVCVLGMVVHTLLFIPRVGAGYQSEPFQGCLVMASALWIGSAVMMMAFNGHAGEHFFKVMMIGSTVFVLIAAFGSVLADLLANAKPHNLIFCGLACVTAILLFANGFIFIESELLQTAAAVLAMVSVYFEKHQTVIHLQLKPVLPEPYSQFERRLFYRPVLSEWLNLISGIAAVVAVTYGVMIIRIYILPWITGLIW